MSTVHTSSRGIGKFSETPASRAAGHPGEPLYEFSEIADKLGVDLGRLRGLARHHGGIPSWKRNTVPTSGKRTRYRLSDAKKWWASLPEGVRK